MVILEISHCTSVALKYGDLALQVGGVSDDQVGGVSDETVKEGREFCRTSTQE
jgi:hypothetical protein